MADLVSDVSEIETEAATALPAPFANRIIVSFQNGESLARIAFLENRHLSDGGVIPHARAAVTVTLSDLEALRDVIIRVLSDARKG